MDMPRTTQSLVTRVCAHNPPLSACTCLSHQGRSVHASAEPETQRSQGMWKDVGGSRLTPA